MEQLYLTSVYAGGIGGVITYGSVCVHVCVCVLTYAWEWFEVHCPKVSMSF